MQGWLNLRPLAENGIILPLFEESFPPIYRYATQNLEFKMDVLEAFVIRQCCDLLQGLIPGKDDKETSGNITAPMYNRLYVFTIMWSIGAFLELDDRAKLETFMRTSDEFNLDMPEISDGSDEAMFDYFVDFSNEGKWEHWNKKVVAYDYPSDHTPEYSSILVPNVDNVRTDFLIQTIAKQEKAVLLIGEQGTAKTVIINSYMSHYNPEYHLSKQLNFSSATTPLMFQVNNIYLFICLK